MKFIQLLLSRLFSLIVFLGILCWCQAASAQNNNPQPPVQPGVTGTAPSIVTTPPSDNAEEKTGGPAASPLVIGPGDELELAVYGAPDLSGHMRVSANGNISIPLIGYVRIAGLTSSEAEASEKTATDHPGTWNGRPGLRHRASSAPKASVSILAGRK